MNNEKVLNKKSYIILADLLKKSRSEYKQNKIEDILKSNLSIPVKIKKIQEIDLLSEREQLKIRPKLMKHEVLYSLPESDTISFQKAERYREVIKRNFIAHNYLSFLLHDFFQISLKISLSLKPSILKYSYFPPKIELNLKNSLIYNKNIKKPAAALDNELDLILEKAWMYISKADHNILMLLSRFCKKASVIDPILLLKSGKNLLINMYDTEILFLTLNYKKDYINRILSSIITVKKTSIQGNLSEKQITELINQLLIPSVYDYTMHDFITELNIFYYNRYLDFQDIITTEEIHPISNFDFDQSLAAKEEKRKYLDDVEKEMKEIIDNLKEINRSAKHLTYKEDKTIDDGLLIEYYNNSKITQTKEFMADRSWFPKMVVNFVEIFMCNFDDILIRQIELKTCKKLTVFNLSIFKGHLDLINLCSSKLARLLNEMPQMNKDRFDLIQNSIEKGTITEKEVVKIVHDILNEFYAIAMKMTSIIENSTDSQNNPFSLQPVNEHQIFDKKIIIPHYDTRIKHCNYVNDKKIIEILKDIIKISLLINLEVYNSKFSIALKTKSKLQQNLLFKKDNLKRIANPMEYESIKTRINFPAIILHDII